MKIIINSIGIRFNPYNLYKEHLFIKAAIEKGNDIFVFVEDTDPVNSQKLVLPYKIIPIKMTHINTFFNKLHLSTNDFIDKIIQINPDFIYFNCPQTLDLYKLKYLKKVLPNLKTLLIFASSFENSAKNLASYFVLHKIIYFYSIKSNINFIDHIMHVSPQVKEFISKVYKISSSEYLRLPGIVLNPQEKAELRLWVYKKHNFPLDAIVITHSGKMDKNKNTIQIINAFKKVNYKEKILILIGTISNSIKEEFLSLIKDQKNILYLKYMPSNELIKYLAASTLYVQPGSVSHTAQQAICSGTAVILKKNLLYTELVKENGFLISNINELDSSFNKFFKYSDRKIFEDSSFSIAKNLLDYKKSFSQILKSLGYESI